MKTNWNLRSDVSDICEGFVRAVMTRVVSAAAVGVIAAALLRRAALHAMRQMERQNGAVRKCLCLARGDL